MAGPGGLCRTDFSRPSRSVPDGSRPHWSLRSAARPPIEGSVTVSSIVGWLELAVFVALAAASTAQWRKRRDETAAWLAAMFTLLGGILLGDRFVPVSVKIIEGWFDRLTVMGPGAFSHFPD